MHVLSDRASRLRMMSDVPLGTFLSGGIDSSAIVTKVDRMSMAHSIETRAPLLDHELVEFAATIPPDLKLQGTATKVLFKRAMRGLLPDEIIDRPKRGFAIPLGHWFRGGLGTFARDLPLSDKSRSRGIFDLKCIEDLLKFHDKGRELDLHIWTLISFERERLLSDRGQRNRSGVYGCFEKPRCQAWIGAQGYFYRLQARHQLYPTGLADFRAPIA